MQKNFKLAFIGDGFCLGKIRGRVNAPPLQDFGDL